MKVIKKGAGIKKAQDGVVSSNKLNKIADSLMDSSRMNKKIAAAYYRKPGKYSKEDNDAFLKASTKAEKDSVNATRYKTLINQAKSKLPKKKTGGMIKRADGSMSKRGLWDNIRANKGSGKKPTAAMLKQEKKIKAKK